ncbi:hypothetical protein BN1723_019247, partial [Verticillium longisporum]
RPGDHHVPPPGRRRP